MTPFQSLLEAADRRCRQGARPPLIKQNRFKHLLPESRKCSGIPRLGSEAAAGFPVLVLVNPLVFA